MGTRVGLREEQSWGYGDQSWINGRLGYDQCRAGTLALPLFSSAHVNENGDIPSGIALAKMTGGTYVGCYGPYVRAGSNGADTAAGHLFYDVHVRNDATGENDLTGKQGFALFWMGIVKESRLPTFTGTDGELDSAGKADLTHIRYE